MLQIKLVLFVFTDLCQILWSDISNRKLIVVNHCCSVTHDCYVQCSRKRFKRQLILISTSLYRVILIVSDSAVATCTENTLVSYQYWSAKYLRCPESERTESFILKKKILLCWLYRRNRLPDTLFCVKVVGLICTLQDNLRRILCWLRSLFFYLVLNEHLSVCVSILVQMFWEFESQPHQEQRRKPSVLWIVQCGTFVP
jgi:hypothetical protein